VYITPNLRKGLSYAGFLYYDKPPVKYVLAWGVGIMSKEDKIILSKALQDEMTKFFFEATMRRKKQEQCETRLSENYDRSGD